MRHMKVYTILFVYMFCLCRYGATNESVHFGDPIAGTLCSRSFRICDQWSCRLQSPGFPGIYPRNAHCLYRIAHRIPVPDNRRVVIGLSQADARKIHLRDWEQRDRLRSWSECEAYGDYVVIYDGASTSSSVLARFCGSGPLAEIISSGPDVVVEFRSSVFDTVYSSSTAIEGFELNIRIITLENNNSSNISDSANRCQYNLTSTGLSKGILNNSLQTWPPQTTCQFRFQGIGDEKVWIYFLKYYFSASNSKFTRKPIDSQCRNNLQIIDGQNTDNVMGLYCRDKPPPLCERFLTGSNNNSHVTSMPPCLLGESFRSTGSLLTIQQQLPEGTAFQTWRYSIYYEFVKDTSQGKPLLNNSCHHVFNSFDELRGQVKSPQNVFLYGRGGSRNLRYNCFLHRSSTVNYVVYFS